LVEAKYKKKNITLKTNASEEQGNLSMKTRAINQYPKSLQKTHLQRDREEDIL
jgi:hypothetical protein